MKTSRLSLLAAVVFAATPSLLVAQVDPKWEIHDRNRPNPPVVTPGTASTQEAPGKPPSDAIVLFDGKDLSQWVQKKDGSPAKWKVENGYFEVAPKTGDLRTKESFGDCQLHVEFREPDPPKGEDQDRGNSGVFLMGLYEIQVLDSYNSKTYADGQASAVYGQYPPLVNASRAPGQWQTYDIIWHGPRFDASGKLTRPGARHCPSQRRTHAGQRRAYRTDGPSCPSAVRSRPGQAAARSTGSQSPGPLPQHLDSRIELGLVLEGRGAACCAPIEEVRCGSIPRIFADCCRSRGTPARDPSRRCAALRSPQSRCGSRS